MAGTQQLFAALNALYHQEGSEIKEQANRFLEQWQQTVEAWSVSDSVLHDPGSTMEAQYFCAQTLRTKVQRDFEELPSSAVDSLRDSLMTLLLKYAKGPPPVRTQLCLALVALTVHVPAERWAPPPGVAVPEALQGGGAVTWFAMQLQRAAPEVALPCLLELLTVLPQEVNSLKYAVRPDRRRQHAMELRAATGAAINILTTCLTGGMGGGAQRPAVLEAFGAWMRLSEGAALGPDGNLLGSHPLVAASLEGLRSGGELFHAAVDAVCELVWGTVDPSSGAIDAHMMPLIQVLVPAVMALRPRFVVAAHRAAEELEDDEREAYPRPTTRPPTTDEFDDDEHTAKGMARLFAEVGEAYVNLIATAVQEVQAPVEALLEVAAHPEHALAAMSFNFWHKLARGLSSGWDPRTVAQGRAGGLMDVALEAVTHGQVAVSEQSRRRAFFTPAFQRLVLVVRGKVRFPPSVSSWTKEAAADFRRQRYEIADSLEDCASVLGYTACLDLLVQPLAQLSADTAAGKPFDWRTAEAALFCIRSIGPYVLDLPAGQPPQLGHLLAALPTLPRASPLLQSCVCYTIARYAAWVNTWVASAPGSGQPNAEAAALLTALLLLAVRSLDVATAASAACSALLDLCVYCGRHLGPSVPLLMELYNRLMGGQAAGPTLPEQDFQLLMQAVCVGVCKALPPEQLPAAAGALLRPALAGLQAALGRAAAEGAGGATAAPGTPSLHSRCPYIAPAVDRLAVLLAHFNCRSSVAEMLRQALPVLDEAFSRCVADRHIMERACRTLRLGIKGAASEARPMLQPLLQGLAARFHACRHSAFLFIMSELIKLFGSDEAALPSLAQALSALLLEACSSLKTLQQLQADPEMVDDVFLLGCRALAYSPRLLLPMGGPSGGGAAPSPTPALTALLDTALLGALMQHREACCSVLSFLDRLTHLGQSETPPGLGSAFQSALQPRAPTLMRLLLAGVVGVLPSARLGDIATLLSAFLKAWRQQALQWLVAAVSSLPDSVVTTAEKEAFVGAAGVLVAGGGSDQRVFEGAVDDLADLCRRNPRVRQAAQQALLPPELAAAMVL